MNISFEGKRILVTGADRGIGRDLALRLANNKATVIGLSRTKNPNNLNNVDPRIQIVIADLADWETTKKAVESVLPIDLLVNNAGVACLAPFLDLTEAQFNTTFDINVRGIFNVSQVVARDMIRRKIAGSIVNVSSQASQVALQDHSVYCASKGAVDMLTRALALELGPHNIRVNSVNPTVVMTAMGKLGWSDPVKAKAMIDKIPLGRFAETDEVVDAIVFLLSNRSSMTTGAALPVDGGFLAV